MGGNGFQIFGADGICADDCLQIVPAESGVMNGMECKGIVFHGGYGYSEEGHALYILQPDTSLSPIERCGFIGASGATGTRTVALNITSASISSWHATTNTVKQCFMRDVCLDDSDRSGTTGTASAFDILGGVEDCHIQGRVIGLERELANIDDYAGGTLVGPQRCSITATADAPARVAGRLLARHGAGNGNTLAVTGAANATHGVQLIGGDRVTVKDSRIRGVASGGNGVRVNDGVTNVDIIGNDIQGSGGSSIVFASAAASTHRVINNRLGGLATANLGTAVATGNI